MQIQPIVPSEYAKGYDTDTDFHSAYAKLQQGKTSEFQLKDGLMYKGTQLCILEDGDRLQSGHFGVEKTLLNLRRYVYWPKMHLDVSRYIRGCVLCNTSKPSNRKLGLYLPLPVPRRPLLEKELLSYFSNMFGSILAYLHRLFLTETVDS
ncbi:hypothetical protein ACE6H2_019188 [Prunus campanulata]